MPVHGGEVSVTTAATPQFAFTVGPNGALVQNLGGGVVTLGPPTMAAGVGPTLPASQTAPVAIPGGIPLQQAAETAPVTDDVWVSGTVTGAALAWMTNI